MKLKAQMYSGFGFIVFFLAVISLIIFFSFSSLLNDVNKMRLASDKVVKSGEIKEHAASIAIAMQKIALLLQEEKQGVSNHAKIAGKIKEYSKEIDSLRKGILERVDFLTQNIHTEEGKRLLDKVRQTREKYVGIQNEFLDISLSEKPDKVEKALEKINLIIEGRYLDNYLAETEELIVYQEKIAAESFKSSEKNANFSKMVVFAVSFFALICSVAIAYFITNGLFKKLGAEPSDLDAIAQKVADFDLTVGKKIDEKAVGVYAVFLKLSNQMALMIEKIRQSARTIENSGVELQASATQLKSAASDAENKSSEIKISGTTAAESVSSVAAAMEQMVATITEISRNTANAKDAANKANNEALSASDVISSLSQSADKVGNITKLIGDIASQTNLLALNATIESARAGEAGKGFAVVANEVKELAKQTAQAVGDIESIVQAIQDQTKSTQLAVNHIVNAVENVTDLTNNIASAVEEQSVTATEISQRIQQADTQVQNTTSAIGVVAAASSQTNQSADSVQASATELKRQSEILVGEVAKFRL